MGFSRQESWSGCHFLLQGIFLNQESNPHLLHWQADSFSPEPQSTVTNFNYMCTHTYTHAYTYIQTQSLFCRRKITSIPFISTNNCKNDGHEKAFKENYNLRCRIKGFIRISKRESVEVLLISKKLVKDGSQKRQEFCLGRKN